LFRAGWEFPTPEKEKLLLELPDGSGGDRRAFIIGLLAGVETLCAWSNPDLNITTTDISSLYTGSFEYSGTPAPLSLPLLEHNIVWTLLPKERIGDVRGWR